MKLTNQNSMYDATTKLATTIMHAAASQQKNTMGAWTHTSLSQQAHTQQELVAIKHGG